MSVWKLGCRWGKGKPPLFFDFLAENQFVIGVESMEYQPGDAVLLTDGFLALGVARVVGESEQAFGKPQYQKLFDDYQVEAADHILAFKARVYRFSEADTYEYKLQQGIVEMHREHAEKVIELLEHYEGGSAMNDIIGLLHQKKRIILQGAPGVGKTYTTKEAALRILGVSVPTDRHALNAQYQDAVKRGQIAFVTFHQSMDYEDFVEGYKPAEGAGGNPIFIRRDGPFKKIVDACFGQHAEEAFEKAWSSFIDSFEGKTNIETKTIAKKTPFYVRLTDNGALRVGLDGPVLNFV